MKKTIITLLATAALTASAFAANDAATQPQQQPQAQQSQDTQQQSQPQNGQQQNQNQASNQQPGQNLSRGEVRQMQTALNKQGFKAGRADGKLGPETRHAVQAFNQKKGIQSQNGEPTDQTLAELGLNQQQNQPQQNDNQQQPDHNSQ